MKVMVKWQRFGYILICKAGNRRQKEEPILYL